MVPAGRAQFQFETVMLVFDPSVIRSREVVLSVSACENMRFELPAQLASVLQTVGSH